MEHFTRCVNSIKKESNLNHNAYGQNKYLSFFELIPKIYTLNDYRVILTCEVYKNISDKLSIKFSGTVINIF